MQRIYQHTYSSACEILAIPKRKKIQPLIFMYNTWTNMNTLHEGKNYSTKNKDNESK
jgi:hypothetical protein